MKAKTINQIESMRQKAVRFLRDVVGDPDKAEEFEAMSPSDYAEHKKIRMIENPASQSNRRSTTTTMARKTYADLQAEVKDLKEENADLSDRMDTILDIVSPQEDDDDDETEDDEDDDEGE